MGVLTNSAYRLTLLAVVAAVRHGCLPSYFPIETMRAWILWLNFIEKTGTNMIAINK